MNTHRTVFDDCHSQQHTSKRVMSRSVPSLVVITMNTNREDPVILRLIPFETNTPRSNYELERGDGVSPVTTP